MNAAPIIHCGVALLLAPLMVAIINRTKAIAVGRRGQPLLQPYFDLARLLRKDAVYSRTTTWVFRAGPIVSLAVPLVALTLMPFASTRALLAFPGDFLLLVYLFGVARFFLVVSALDTGSSFEGMGASREVTFSALTEPALLIGLLAMTRQAGDLSLSGIYGRLAPISLVAGKGPMLLLVAAAFTLVYLSENARIPFDDPNTHLELTMIHEVMVLDHSGPDFAFIQYAAALKLWVFGALVVGILLPLHGFLFAPRLLAAVGGMFVLAVVTGVIESTMARLRLVRVPQLLVAAAVLSVLALILVLG
jgi:formate hydrogenlyase subunit 4